jgi:hypothetical protein
MSNLAEKINLEKHGAEEPHNRDYMSHLGNINHIVRLPHKFVE